MTPEQLHANRLISYSGKEKARDHVEFVLGRKFNLLDEGARKYWHNVLYLINQTETDSLTVEVEN